MKILLFYFFSLNIFSTDYIDTDWRYCQSESDCQVVYDMGCKNQCVFDAISKKFKDKLVKKINRDCSDILAPTRPCAKDDRAKLPRCIKNRCQLMTKHVCCTNKDPMVRKDYNCHLKKVNCKDIPFK